MRTETLNTPAAGTWARDCELINLIFDHKGFRMTYHRDEDDTYWVIHCDTLTAYKVISEELSRDGYLLDLPYEGAFFEILDSPWIDELGGKTSKILIGCKHFVLKFYDHTIEILAPELAFEQLKEKPANIPC